MPYGAWRCGAEARDVGMASEVDTRVATVRLRAVDYSYKGQAVLSNLEMTIAPGRVYALLGRNGAGKSTTFKLLLGLLRPDSGVVEIFGRSFTRAALAEVGATVDGPALYSHLSAHQNLQVHASLLGISEKRISEVLDIVGLGGSGRKAAKKFSTGMKARLALASALLDNPDLLLLDEPQNGLDPEGVRELRTLIRDLASGGKTVLISSHQLGEVMNVADDIGVLAQGHLSYEGPLDQFAPDGDLERAYFAATEEPRR